MNIFTGIFTSAAVLFRKELGDRYAGLTAIARAIFALLVFAVLVSWARGYFIDTGLGRFIDVPVVYPMLLLSVLIVVVWAVRSAGRLDRLGPLRGDSAPVAFSGHASDLFPRWRSFRNEWRLLDTAEPATLLLAGLVLVLIPPVRIIGLYLILAAVVVLWQTASDRRLNDRSPTFGGFATVVPPMPEDASRLSVERQLLDLPEGLLTLFDSETQTNIQTRRERLERALGPSEGDEQETADRPDGGDWRPRGLLSAHPPRYLPYGVVAMMLLTALNLHGGDPMGIYKAAPERWSAAMDSFQLSGSALGLFPSPDPLEPGVLKYGLWERVDPGAIERHWTGLYEQHQAAAHNALLRLESLIDASEDNARRLIGTELNPDAGFPLLDRLLIRSEQASDLWATAVAEATAARRFIGDGHTALRATVRSPREPDITALQELAEKVAVQDERSIIITQSVEQLHRMLATLEAQEALDEFDRRRNDP